MDAPALSDPASGGRTAARAARDAAPAATPPSLGELLVDIQSDDEAVYDAAWTACFAGYHGMVFRHALAVLRRVAWLAEPREEALDVASRVLGELRDSARAYRHTGRAGAAEAWLRTVTVRKATRRTEELTGNWNAARTAPHDAERGGGGRGRQYVRLDHSAEEVAARLDAVEPEERLELERRVDALRRSADPTKRRWGQFVDLYIEGHSYRTIAERLGIAEGTAANWMQKICDYLSHPPG